MWIIFVLAIVAVLVAVALVAMKNKGLGGKSLRYKSKPLLTANEKEFFLRLKRALPNHIILTQVSMGQVMQPAVSRQTKPNKDKSESYMSIRGTFAQKSIDYVVCNEELEIVAIVELDDKTHSSDKDGKRDAMLEEAGYKILRFNSKKKPTEAEIASKLEELINPKIIEKLGGEKKG